MERLPPLNAVRAFEAAARHLSITQASIELSVTPGAVSRQIQLLEEFIGARLLARGHREISLTQEGEQFFRVATRSIAEIREVTQQLKGVEECKRLKVRAYTTFAMRWLIPRLSSFHATHPGVEVMLTASLEMVNFKKEDLDCAIRLGNGQWPGVNSYRLVSNILVPVCSPELLKSGPELKKPVDLRRLNLLHSIARADDWKHWLKAQGAQDEVDSNSGLTYQSSAMVYSAAIEGHGVAMAQLFLVESDLQSGKLVRPFPEAVDMGDYTYYLLTPIDRKESTAMKQFRTWLLEQFSGNTQR
jgi:LysR family transcriptional regulator, glycine cleavage system transcriptional activator